jgi:hypothetical protein
VNPIRLAMAATLAAACAPAMAAYSADYVSAAPVTIPPQNPGAFFIHVQFADSFDPTQHLNAYEDLASYVTSISYYIPGTPGMEQFSGTPGRIELNIDATLHVDTWWVYTQPTGSPNFAGSYYNGSDGAGQWDGAFIDGKYYYSDKAPGTWVLSVPEPSESALLALGVLALATQRGRWNARRAGAVRGSR